MTPKEKIDLMIKYIESFLGTPYKFGGNVTQDGGLDCSALVLEGLRSIGEWDKKDATAQMIYNNLTSRIKRQSVYMPSKGDVIFFGKSTNDITHVAIAYNSHFMIEAGGNNTDGMVRIRPIEWRKDKVAIVRTIL